MVEEECQASRRRRLRFKQHVASQGVNLTSKQPERAVHSIMWLDPQCIMSVRVFADERSAAILMLTTKWVQQILHKSFPAWFDMCRTNGAVHRVCTRSHKTVDSLRAQIGKSWGEFWCNGARLENEEVLHKSGIGLGSTVFETVQIFLKTVGGDVVTMDVALQSTTPPQLMHSFVRKAGTLKAAIGVLCRGALPEAVADKERLESTLALPANPNHYCFIFQRQLLAQQTSPWLDTPLVDKRVLGDCGVTRDSTIHVVPHSCTPAWRSLNMIV